jgi:hypothetical protein
MLVITKGAYMFAKNYIAKYSPQHNKKAIVQYYKIPATTKWVEYMLDRHEINKILMDSDFATKMDLLETLQILERKIDYMYKHPNFNFKKATDLFHIMKNATKVATNVTVVNKQTTNKKIKNTK